MQRGHRASTTPMDFEWTNHNGPVDPSSPFMNIHGQPSAKKRPHSVLDSPSKSAFATPQRASQYTQGDGKPLPLPPHVHDAWQPRTPASTYDASSGGETPNTPAVDSDAATPDTQLADKMGRLANGDVDALKRAPRRESWFKRAFGGSPSPTKERERDRDDARKHYPRSGGEHRVQKRRSEKAERSRSKKRSAPRDSDGDDSDKDQQLRAADMSNAHAPAIVKQTYAMSVAGFLHWVEAHPHLPSVLSFYLQLAVNLFLAGGFVYILYCAWSGIMSDVDIESSKHVSGVLIDIRECAEQYRINRCHPDPVPSLSKLCAGWEACMNRDAKKVARASVTAKTFAKIFNSFVEEFSYKSMVFTALIIFGGFNLSNWAFGLLRTQQQQQHSTPNPNDYIPQTPHRVPSNSYLEHNQQGFQQNWQQHTPYQTPYGSMRHIEPPPLLHAHSMPALPMAPQESVGLLEDRKTPRKRGLFR
ncbi:Di-sulfide bridge nucleocytoplasmic transport domain-containing protein [Paraphoma chrysanthemicola]|nr:Di-sulfide bridge nucleocytoplasmic transport domain-containing protein [Paraphoma chrysanthemicola]